MIADPRVLQIAVTNGVIQARLRLRETSGGGLKARISNADPFERKIHYWRVNEGEKPALDFDPRKDIVRAFALLESLLAFLPAPAFVWVEDAEQLDPGDEGTVLLVPLNSDPWREVGVGREVDMVAYAEDRPPGRIVEGDPNRVVGRAKILDVNLRPDHGLRDEYMRPIDG